MVGGVHRKAPSHLGIHPLQQQQKHPVPYPNRLEPGCAVKPQVVWTIAGFDPSSGAGITADLTTFAAHGLFGCSAITALTVQSTLGVVAVELVRPALLTKTLDHLAADLPPAGVKLGMLGSPELAIVVADFLADRSRTPGGTPAPTPTAPVIFDPVLRSSSGHELFPQSALNALATRLLPQVDWITPNWGELSLLTGLPVNTEAEAEQAARELLQRHPRINVVVTGGDQRAPKDLFLLHTGQHLWIAGEHIATRSTHGTGCAFASALLANLVNGAEPEAAVRSAKAYVAEALRSAPGLGHGSGPMDLLWPLR